MPLKVFFRSGPTISRRDNFLAEVHPGAFTAFPEFIHFPSGDDIGYVVLASCLRGDAWSEILMLRPEEVANVVKRGSPWVYHFADYLLEPGQHRSFHVGHADNPLGTLTLLHSVVAGNVS